MTTDWEGVESTLSGTGGDQVEMEVSYRLPYTGYVRVLAGGLSAPALRRPVISPVSFRRSTWR
jgi:hypothetical protein